MMHCISACWGSAIPATAVAEHSGSRQGACQFGRFPCSRLRHKRRRAWVHQPLKASPRHACARCRRKCDLKRAVAQANLLVKSVPGGLIQGPGSTLSSAPGIAHRGCAGIFCVRTLLLGCLRGIVSSSLVYSSVVAAEHIVQLPQQHDARESVAANNGQLDCPGAEAIRLVAPGSTAPQSTT